MSTNRYSLAECAGSSIVTEKGSPNTVLASSKLNRCFLRLARALSSSQSKSKAISDGMCQYLLPWGRSFRESVFDSFAQAVATLSTRVAAPVADDMPVGGDHERLRDRVPAVHQRARRQWVSPAQAEAKINIAHEPLHTIGRRARVFGCQT